MASCSSHCRNDRKFISQTCSTCNGPHFQFQQQKNNNTEMVIPMVGSSCMLVIFLL